MTRCDTCGGEGFVVEFRRFAGEAMAGEPYEVPCPEGCEPDDEDDYVSPPTTEASRAAYRAWCDEQDARLAAQVERELRRTIELQRKDKAA